MKCKWCGHAVAQTTPPASKPQWDRWICGGCGAMGYYQDPSMKELQSIYSNAWEDPEDAGKFAAGSTSESIARALINHVCLDHKDVRACLDYGAGKGVLASQLVESGYECVHVVEPFGSDANIAGVVWNRDWDDIPSERKFDRVFMVEVVEHLIDPVDVLQRARTVLSESGSILITTPNTGGWRAFLQKGKWREAQNPAHLNLFSFQTLKICLKRAGYTEIHRVTRTMPYGKTGVAALLLRVTQLLRIDGSLRVIAK